jgi:hypothetical protein
VELGAGFPPRWILGNAWESNASRGGTTRRGGRATDVNEGCGVGGSTPSTDLEGDPICGIFAYVKMP